jgi:hypothetical protein
MKASGRHLRERKEIRVTVFTAEDVRIQQYGNAAVVAFKLV